MLRTYDFFVFVLCAQCIMSTFCQLMDYAILYKARYSSCSMAYTVQSTKRQISPQSPNPSCQKALKLHLPHIMKQCGSVVRQYCNCKVSPRETEQPFLIDSLSLQYCLAQPQPYFSEHLKCKSSMFLFDRFYSQQISFVSETDGEQFHK